MATEIWEYFGFRVGDTSRKASSYSDSGTCPITEERCVKHFNDGVTSGVCSLKPSKGGPVICCPIRMYSHEYKVIGDVVEMSFGAGMPLKNGREAVRYSVENGKRCVAVFGQRWGGELRLPQKKGKGGYFVDWVLALISEEGKLLEFVAVEVQTIDTTNSYRSGFEALQKSREAVPTKAGFNWENVNKRILPQLIYKGQILQREPLCKNGLFFICPSPVYRRILDRVGGEESLIRYTLQPASITFMVYEHSDPPFGDGEIVPLRKESSHTTTVYKLQESFNNVTLPDEGVYQEAILKALGIPAANNE